MSLKDAPELAVISGHVGTGIQAVNRAIAVLRDRHADNTRLVDAIDMAYDPDAVQQFQAAAQGASQAFAAAQETANAWFIALSAALSQNLASQHGVEQQQRTVAENLATTKQQLSAAREKDAQLRAQLALHASSLTNAADAVRQAESRLDDARAARNATRVAGAFLFFVFPVAGFTALAISCTALENAVDEARDNRHRISVQLENTRKALENTQQSLGDLCGQVASMESRAAELGSQAASLVCRTGELTAMRDRLVRIRPMVLECVHTVNAALGSTRTLDNMLSLSNVASAVRCLSGTLRVDFFAGPLPGLCI